jgi:hypothetical protein
MAAAGGLALPFTTGLSTLLIPDGRHTVLDGSGVIRVRATVGSDSQEQSDPTHQFGWAATSALGGRAVLTRPVSTPYLLTAAGAALAHPFVIYAVIGPPTSAPASLIFDGNASGSRAFLANISASQYQMGGASGSITGTHTVPSSGSLFTCIYDGASSELRANGVSLGTGTTSTAAIDHAVWGARFSFSNPSGALMALFAIQTGHPTGPQIEANEAAIMEWFSL